VIGEKAVYEALRAAARPFGAPRRGADEAVPVLRWGVLFADLDGSSQVDQGYVTAIELIYEGYLLHYRESRLLALPASQPQATLLAGDYLYARGLRVIASRGDADAVGLLARLMGACSYLRSVDAPFAADDALWAYTMGGLVALRHGVATASADGLFDQIDGAFAAGASVEVPSLVRAAIGGLGLPDQEPLRRSLDAALGR
jgi:hypothetical protein